MRPRFAGVEPAPQPVRSPRAPGLGGGERRPERCRRMWARRVELAHLCHHEPAIGWESGLISVILVRN